MLPSIISSIISNILIVVLIIYQIQKNKNLQDQIKSQNRIITQTNEIVSRQATAIESQSKIVDTALKYSNTFSVERIESVIRREFNIEKAEELRHVEEQYKEIINKEMSEKCRIDNEKKRLEQCVDIATKELLVPYMSTIIRYLLTHQSEKDVFLGFMEDGKSKEILVSTYNEVETDYISKFKKAEIENA
jgi:hypothetical protein